MLVYAIVATPLVIVILSIVIVASSAPARARLTKTEEPTLTTEFVAVIVPDTPAPVVKFEIVAATMPAFAVNAALGVVPPASTATLNANISISDVQPIEPISTISVPAPTAKVPPEDIVISPAFPLPIVTSPVEVPVFIKTFSLTSVFIDNAPLITFGPVETFIEVNEPAPPEPIQIALPPTVPPKI